jgi:hypothetical protein
MKIHNKSIDKFLQNGEDGLDIADFEEDLDDELSNGVRVQPMRSVITKNKKEDAHVYKNLDAKRRKR